MKLKQTNILLLTLLALTAATTGRTQNLQAFKQQLATPSALHQAQVRVAEHGDAARAIDRAAQEQNRKSFHGYRVCIFFDNSQEARAEAFRAEALLKEYFAGIRVYTVYDNPYFRVTAGNCLSMEEAIILKGKLSTLFPKAFVKNEELTLADLIE